MLRPKPSLTRPSGKTVLTLALVLLGAWSLLGIESPERLGSLSSFAEIFGAALRPDLSPGYLSQVVSDVLTTFAYAAASMSIALLIGAVFGAASSSVLSKAPHGRAAALLSRAILIFFRSFHELIWALLFVQVLGLTPWAGILAIGIPYGGILGRIFSDQIQDAPAPPLDALKAAGASNFLILIYGHIQMMKGTMFSYLTYRFECALRSAAVLSFIGLGGIGFRLELALDDLNYPKAWTAIWALVILVIGFDFLTARLQNRLFPLSSSSATSSAVSSSPQILPEVPRKQITQKERERI